MRKILSTADKILVQIETYLMVLSMVVFAFSVVVDVLCRKLFGFSLSFMQELGKYLMVWATFIGASLGVKYDEHPSMTLVIDSVPRIPKMIMSALVNLVSCGACGFAAYWSVKQFLLLRKMGTMTTTLGKIPVYVLYIIVPLGLIMMTIRFLIQAFCRPIAIAAEGKGR